MKLIKNAQVKLGGKNLIIIKDINLIYEKRDTMSLTQIKIAHVMKDSTDKEGIPTLPFLLSINLAQRWKKSLHYVMVTRSSNLIHFKVEIRNTKIIEGEILKIIKTLIKEKPQLLIIHHHFGNPVGVLILILSKFLGIKTVVHPDFNEYGLPKIHKSIIKTIKDILRYFLILVSIVLPDKLIFPTRYELEVLSKIKKIPKRKYVIIPFGIDWDIKTCKKENYILTVSRWWRDRKNLHTILKVFSEVIKIKPDVKLIIVGKFLKGMDTEYEVMYGKKMTGEEYKQKIISLINELNLQHHISFVGAKHGEELQDLFRKAKIYYMPTKFETFGMVFVEAMASGTPIVAMKNSAVQYVVKDGVTGFLRNDEEGQKDAILRLLTDERLYKEMQKNCLKEAEKYRWESVIKKWERLIEELVEGKDEGRGS